MSLGKSMPHPLIWKDDLPEPELVLGSVAVLVCIIRCVLAAGATMLIVATSESRYVFKWGWCAVVKLQPHVSCIVCI